MATNILSFLSRRNLQVMTLAVTAVVASFSLGIQSAGDVQPISLIEAGSVSTRGDMDGDGVVDLEDVTFILEVSQGYRTASPEQLRNDPNQDGALTVDDALSLLSSLTAY